MEARSSSWATPKSMSLHVDGIPVDEHDVLGLDVPVDHAALVGVLEGAAQLDAHLAGCRCRSGCGPGSARAGSCPWMYSVTSRVWSGSSRIS